MNQKLTALALGISTVLSAGQASANDSMAFGLNGYTVSAPLLTIGETLYYTDGDLNPSTAGAYTPPGILDGLGAYELDKRTVRVFANHELTFGDGYPYEVSDGQGGTFSMTGARVSYFDIDKFSKDIVDAGLAYNVVYDANGNIATDRSFLPQDQEAGGFTRFCSAVLVDPLEFGGKGRGHGAYGAGRGIVDRTFFTGEETGGNFTGTGGAEWALDVETGALWAVPAMGRGAWENITQVDTGSKRKVAFILADDQSPFDADGDGMEEAAPLYLYVGTKQKEGNFLERNGLSGGKLYVFVPDDPAKISPAEFNTAGTLDGSWVEIDNSPSGIPSNDGSTGFDEYGYPTQRTLWTRAEALNAFQFSRPEDVATNPKNGSEAVLASTGRENEPDLFGTADQFGTIYTIDTNFRNMKAELRIVYDGDADPEGILRSPDNLEWADDGMIYVQEDKAVSTDLYTARNSAESGIVRLDPWNGSAVRVAEIDRSIVLDASIPVWTDAVDEAPDEVGKPESSGILDVSKLFDEPHGSLFLFDVQNHGIDDQERYNEDSRIIDEDLKEGGQLLFLRRTASMYDDDHGYGYGYGDDDD
ncbi:MAG: DUF839 domain-containing protein [Gammaproteobacteria bacterium]